ncbi:MAG: hypothetical protein ACI4R8_01305 [Candidatus Caccovivens sp.]
MAIEIPKEDLIYKENYALEFLCRDILKQMKIDLRKEQGDDKKVVN